MRPPKDWLLGVDPLNPHSYQRRTERGFVCVLTKNTARGLFGDERGTWNLYVYAPGEKEAGRCPDLYMRDEYVPLDAALRSFDRYLSAGRI